MLKKYLFSLFLIFILSFVGCTTINQSIYVQDIKVKGPISEPPLYITNNDNNKSITISPKFYLNTTNQTTDLVHHSNVDKNGIYKVDTVSYSNQDVMYAPSSDNTYEFKGQNLIWNLPDLYAGVDIDLPLSQKVSIEGSINYTNQEQTNLLGGSVGFGFYNQKGNNAMRIDLGLTFQEYWYDAQTVVVTTTKPIFGNQTTRVDFYHDIDKNTSINPYISLTYNSTSDKLPFNFYGSLRFFGQTLFDVKPNSLDAGYYPFGINVTTNYENTKHSTSFVSFSPGIYENVTEDSRIILGVSLLKDLNAEHGANSFYVVPMIKFDMSL